ncbi:MAG: hypothetical protein V2I31_09995 [Mariniphaga sp.]|jgi:hypothetical protein|nr:hypothetical protein [Mariniphaga sp.]
MSMDDLKLLRGIQENLEEIDFESIILPENETGSGNMLSVKFRNNHDEDQSLIINIMPLSNDLEGSSFIQFYYEYPFLIPSPCPGELKTLINNINRQLPLGHFNTNIAWSQIYYKYVLALSLKTTVFADQLSDIMDMIIYSVQHFEEEFSVFKKD